MLEALRNVEKPPVLVKLFEEEKDSFKNKAQIDSECAFLHSYAVSYRLNIQIAILTTKNGVNFELIQNLANLVKPSPIKAQINYLEVEKKNVKQLNVSFYYKKTFKLVF